MRMTKFFYYVFCEFKNLVFDMNKWFMGNFIKSSLRFTPLYTHQPNREDLLFVWDVYTEKNKWLQTVTAPINWDAYNVQEFLVSQGYNKSIYVTLRHSSQIGQPHKQAPLSEN